MTPKEIAGWLGFSDRTVQKWSHFSARSSREDTFKSERFKPLPITMLSRLHDASYFHEHQERTRSVTWRVARNPARGSFLSITAQSVSGEKLGEREGAMATRWDQVVLPVGRVQDRINACIGRARRELKDRPIGIVAIHREPCAIEVPNRRLEDYKVQSSRGLGAEVISDRV